MTHNPEHLAKHLTFWDRRKTEGSDTGLSEFAASIESVGIINPLTVLPTGKRRLVLAGGRRLAALTRCSKSKAIDEE